MKETTNQKTVSKGLESSPELSGEVSKLSIIGIGTVAAFIGGWAVVCLVSGVVASGGPIAMVANWFRAVIG